MNGFGTRTAVLLLAGAGGTYVAFLHPAVGVALVVGLAVVALLHNLLRCPMSKHRPPRVDTSSGWSPTAATSAARTKPACAANPSQG